MRQGSAERRIRDSQGGTVRIEDVGRERIAVAADAVACMGPMLFGADRDRR